MSDEEIISKYGDVPMKFESYYKYVFTFAGKAPDGASLRASIGGNSDDIYKLDVAHDDVMTLKNLSQYRRATVYLNGEVNWEYDGDEGW